MAFHHQPRTWATNFYTTKKFHVYLHGRPFTMTTDHKPLLGILGPGFGVPERASGRILRWILDLATYEYDLKYRPAAKNANADGLSRLPQPGIGTTMGYNYVCLFFKFHFAPNDRVLLAYQLYICAAYLSPLEEMQLEKSTFFLEYSLLS